MPRAIFVGLCTLDVIQLVDRVPGGNEKVTAQRQVIAAGGPATNAAVTYAALGGQAVLVSALGRGVAADVARADLDTCGVEVIDAAPEQVDQLPVSTIVVQAWTGERSVVSVDATSMQVPSVPELGPALATADTVLLDGHHPVLAGSLGQGAAVAGVPIVLDAGRWRPVMAELVPRATAVVCSADFRSPGTETADDSAQALVGVGVPTVVVTNGAGAIRWWHGGRSGAVQPPRVPAVDTAAAGDVFHGAYCFFAGDLESRLGNAARVAALKCAQFGTRSWLTDLSTEHGGQADAMGG